VFLHFTQFARASVLLGLGGVGIFLTLQPKGEPINIALLGLAVLDRPRFCKKC
jgi:hypothetical protein